MIFPFKKKICNVSSPGILHIFCLFWLFFTHSQSLEARDRKSEPHLKQLSALHHKGVCVNVWTRLHADSWGDEWIDEFFKWMQNVFYRSINRQCTPKSPCPLVAQVKIIVRIDGEIQSQKEKLVSGLEKLDKNILWYMDRMGGEKVLVDAIKFSQCSWVSYIFIDADDAFLDGFFQYVTTIITKDIIREEKIWRGGLFIPREIPLLIIGNHNCEVGDFHGYAPKIPFFCGKSSGQGIILRREIWDKLKRKVVPPFLHPWFLRVARDFVMHGLGFRKYKSSSCSHSNFRINPSKDNSSILASERSDAAESGLLLFDLTSDWKTSGVLLRTPFSSHYPWAYSSNISRCTEEKRASVMKEFPKDISWLLEAGDSLPYISMETACINNRYLVPGGLKNNSGCVELMSKISKTV